MADPGVQAAVRDAMARRAGRVELTQDQVLDEFSLVAFARVEELVAYRVETRPGCWGDGNRARAPNAADAVPPETERSGRTGI